MSDLDGNPNCLFSQANAQIFFVIVFRGSLYFALYVFLYRRMKDVPICTVVPTRIWNLPVAHVLYAASFGTPCMSLLSPRKLDSYDGI